MVLVAEFFIHYHQEVFPSKHIKKALSTAELLMDGVKIPLCLQHTYTVIVKNSWWYNLLPQEEAGKFKRKKKNNKQVL